ncbi:uncharacterized protein OCT59_023044 [Rhizophagus irregularis]|uniref:CinA C-terminal domain-containing protein n=3 Tax=Rhizophagus irregularis TaxID=588596 RepID=A0A015IK88_RHIIW|nr:hypothetical protein RirG_205990 [Rhizophagus irregularis DAOM 197198w]UZO29580.1 hypothetical protein OCT59_023044 [Rhizophagus irregularis]
MKKSLVNLLTENNLSLATCESLTGGLFASTLTHIPGASQILKGGLIVYCNEAKKIIAKVSPITLEKYGAVSEQCAREMAQNTQQLLKVDLAISFTGNAGPQALENKPVGLVYISLAIQERLINKSYQFFGSREEIKEQTVEAGIELIEKVLNEKYEKFTIWSLKGFVLLNIYLFFILIFYFLFQVYYQNNQFVLMPFIYNLF